MLSFSGAVVLLLHFLGLALASPVIDSRGPADNTSNTLTLFHYHYSSSTAAIKREVGRRMTQCTGPASEGWHFYTSHCQPQFAPTSYTMTCTRGNPLENSRPEVDIIFGDCQPSEICINTGVAFSSVANCVSVPPFGRVHTIKIQTSAGGMVEVVVPMGAESAEAVVTDEAGGTSVQAQEITLTALKRLFSVSNVPHLGALVNGTASCADCYGVGLDPIPESTDMLRADVRLKGSGSGYLYLTTVS